MNHLVLVLNCGSSSIKFALYDSTSTGVPRQKIWGGKVNGITSGQATFDASDSPRMPLPLSAAKPSIANANSTFRKHRLFQKTRR